MVDRHRPSKHVRHTNFWKKYELLMWKNMLIQLNHKVEFLCEIAIAVFLFSLLIVLRNNFGIDKKPKHEYKPEELNLNTYHEIMTKVKDVPRLEIVYSPKNQFVDNILKDAADLLNTSVLPLPDLKTLRQALREVDFMAAVVFDDYMKEQIAIPKKLRYRIIMPTDLRSKKNLKEKTNTILGHIFVKGQDGDPATWRTDKLYLYEEHGPRNVKDNDGGVPSGYIESGFAAIQHAIAMSYRLQTGFKDPLPPIVLQRFPYPEYTYDTLMSMLPEVLPLMIIASLTMPVFCTTMMISKERELGLKELLKTLGISNWIQWLACFTQSLIVMLICILLLTIMLKVPISPVSGACLNHSDVTVIFIVFFVYILGCISFCCITAVLFGRPLQAAIAAAIIYFLSFLTPEHYDDTLLSSKLIFCLDFNIALSYAIIIIVRHEIQGVGLQWNNLFETATPDDNLSIGLILSIVFSMAVFLMVVSLYCEQLFPGEYGVPRSWDFLFKAKFWNCEWRGKFMHVDIETYDSTYSADDDDFDSFDDSTDNFESDPLRKKRVIEVRQLNKKIGTKAVVREINLNIFESEVTVLLGHEGSGKSTIINMMTGMVSPTGNGTVHINSFDMHTKEAKKVRHVLGVCPQINSLFADLSVRQHLVFHCRLKGLAGDEVDDEVEKYLRVMDLEDETNVKAGKIHTSAQRKLMLCCAMCGGSKVVFCDQPSLDMEPADKYAMWNLLRVEKDDRVIFVTTKTMEEAEILADRMAVICFGEIKCYGTPFFLRHLYGAGYNLICFRMPNCKVERITSLLKKFIPDITLKTALGEEITYLLPDKYSYLYQDMLRHLEDKLDALKIRAFEICTVSIEQVCFQVPGNHVVGGIRTKTLTDSDNNTQNEMTSTILSRNLRLLRGRGLLMNQWQALLLKNYISDLRVRSRLFLIILFPTIMSVFGIFFLIQIGNYGDMPPLLLDLFSFPSGTVLLEVAPDVAPNSILWNMSKNYREHVEIEYVEEAGNKYKFIELKMPFTEYILKNGARNPVFQAMVNTEYLIAATIKNDQIIAWMNDRCPHAAPMTLNILHNAILRLSNYEDSLLVTNSPLAYRPVMQLGRAMSFHNGTYTLINLIAISLFIVTSIKIMHPIDERVSSAKELQLRGGVNTGIYWVTMYAWDSLVYINSVIFVIMAFECFHVNGFNSVPEICMLALVLILYGLVVIPQQYVFSFLFGKPMIGFMVILGYNMGIGKVGLRHLPRDWSEQRFVERWFAFLFFSFSYHPEEEATWASQLLPQQALLMALNNLSYMSISIDICHHSELPIDVLCDRAPVCCKTFKYFVFENPGVLSNLLSMCLNGILFSVCLWLIETLKNFVARFRTVARIKPDYKEIDSDVQAETLKISTMTDMERESYALVVDRISKAYKSCVAVKRISFCVNSRECFGMIGAKGAGLTTVFQMLSGTTSLTRGVAYIRGHNIKTNTSITLKDVSYCPRFNSYLNNLSGRENLRIFALLRGIPSTHVELIIKELTNIFGITKFLDREVNSYSCDNKRKLSVAIALLGNPSIIYLDVPTDGLDPEGKKHLWGAVADIRAAGKAIVLGTDCMAECKALCTRLAIMVNGEFMCIGSMQHLRNKFTQGIVIKITVNIDLSQHNLVDWIYSKTPGRLKGPSDTRAARLKLKNRDDEATQVNLQSIADVKKYIFLKFPGSTLQKEFEGHLTFFMPSQGNLKWSEMFGILDRYRRRSYIEHYEISQATMDRHFLKLAEQQTSKKK